MYICVCVLERERERERDRQTERERERERERETGGEREIVICRSRLLLDILLCYKLESRSIDAVKSYVTKRLDL